MLRILSFAALVLAVPYLAVAGYVYAEQRNLLFFRDAADVDPAEVGLPDAAVAHLEARDGTRLVAWSVAGTGAGTVIYFHGNGGALATRVPRIRALRDLGLSVLAVEYRGSGGSAGEPSEAGFALDADAAYAFVRRQGVPPDRIVLYGESLGTGVSVSLAARRPVAGLILDAPFSSIADIAADRYWMLPVRWLIRDPFRSDLLIGAIAAPILILHGDRDDVVPIRYGRRLLSFAGVRARFVTVEGGGHTVLADGGAREAVKRWLAETLPLS